MKERDIESGCTSIRKPFKRRTVSCFSRSTLTLIFTLYYMLSSLVEQNLASVTDFRIVFATTSKDSIIGCRSNWNGNIVMNWFKASGFDYFDEIDSSFTGTGITRAKKGEGCLAAVPDQWYWMALVSTRFNSTHCEMRAMLRESTATYQGTCSQSSAGVSVWEGLFPGVVQFKQDSQVSYPANIITGHGQEYTVTQGSEDMDGKEWGWLVYGLRYWNNVIPYYLSHFSSPMLFTQLPVNPHLKFKDLYNRIIKYEHLGMVMNHIPFKFKLRKSLNGVPGIFSYGFEFIINNLEDFSYNVPVAGLRQLEFKFKVISQGNDVANWVINFTYDSANKLYVADISVDLSTIVLTGSVSVNSVTTSYLSFFLAFGPAPYQGNLNNIKYHATFKLSNGSQTKNWHNSGVRTIIGIWDNSLTTKISQTCKDMRTSKNCSLTHDFGLTATKYQPMSGSLDRSQIPSNLWETNDPTHDTKCWSTGTSEPSLYLTKCLFCMSAKKKKNNGVFKYYHQKNKYYCKDKFINSSNQKFKNCQVGLDSNKNTCVYCADGYSRNLNFYKHASYTQVCIPEADCNVNSPQVYYEEKTYDYLDPPLTKKFCTSCPQNCEACDSNNDCLSCINDTYANFNSKKKKCFCEIQNCRNCTLSDCDICKGKYLKHITSGTITCQSGPSSGCINGYGLISGEVVPKTFTKSCLPCTVTNCKLCGNDHTVCTECSAGLILLANGSCGTIPTCRSPEKLRPEAQVCGDCSEQYDVLEALESGFCSQAKPYNISIYPTENYRTKSRRYLVESEYFPIDFDPMNGNLELTQEIIDKVFKVELTPSPESYQLIYKGGNMVKLSFSEFEKDMKVTFSLKNATLTEYYRSETDSDLLKVLIQSHYTFRIQNLTSIDEKLLNATISSGNYFGAASSIISKLGTGLVILGTAINLDTSGTIIKALQFILLFDKLRFINVKLDNLLGAFMNRIYAAFKVNLIDVDDYERTAKYSKNQFLSQRVQVMAYRKKIDKLVFGTICLVLDFILLYIKRSIRAHSDEKNVNPKKWVKLAYKYRLADRMRFTLLTLGMVDIMFYCLHQVTHQKISTVTNSFDWDSLTFFWSFWLIFYTLAAFTALYLKMSTIEKWRLTNYLTKVENEFGENKNEREKSPNKNDKNNQNQSDGQGLQSSNNTTFLENEEIGEGEEEKETDITKVTKGIKIKISDQIAMRSVRSVKVKTKAKLKSHFAKPHNNSTKKISNRKKKKLKREFKSSTKLPWTIFKKKKALFEKGARGELLMMKKDGRMIIDSQATISNLEKGEHYIQSICANLTQTSAIVGSNTFNLIYIIRLVAICIPILCLQSIPRIQLTALLLVESCYLSYQIYAFCKWKIPNTKFRFIINSLESFCVINFIVYCAYSISKQTGRWLLSGVGLSSGDISKLDEQNTTTDSGSTDWYEIFVLVCFVLIILFQVFQILVSIFITAKNLIISHKLRKKNKLKNKSQKEIEARYYSNPIIVWKKGQLYYEELEKEQSLLLSTFGPNVKAEQIQTLINNHTKSKRKFRKSRLLVQQEGSKKNSYKNLRSNLKDISSSSHRMSIFSSNNELQGKKQSNFAKFNLNFAPQAPQKADSNQIEPTLIKQSNSKIINNYFNQQESPISSIEASPNSNKNSDFSSNSPTSWVNSPVYMKSRRRAIEQQMSKFRGMFLNESANLNLNNSDARAIGDILTEKNEMSSQRLNNSINFGALKRKQSQSKRDHLKIRQNQNRLLESFRSMKGEKKRPKKRKINKRKNDESLNSIFKLKCNS